MFGVKTVFWSDKTRGLWRHSVTLVEQKRCYVVSSLVEYSKHVWPSLFGICFSFWFATKRTTAKKESWEDWFWENIPRSYLLLGFYELCKLPIVNFWKEGTVFNKLGTCWPMWWTHLLTYQGSWTNLKLKTQWIIKLRHFFFI